MTCEPLLNQVYVVLVISLPGMGNQSHHQKLNVLVYLVHLNDPDPRKFHCHFQEVLISLFSSALRGRHSESDSHVLGFR